MGQTIATQSDRTLQRLDIELAPLEPAADRATSTPRGTPWRWFRKAGITPKDWFPKPEREILAMVYRVHTLKLGWRENDGDRETREGLSLFPGRMAKEGQYSRRTYGKAITFLAKCGYLTVSAPLKGRERFVSSAWWHGPNAEAENLAALLKCFARHKRIRPRRSRKPPGGGK